MEFGLFIDVQMVSSKDVQKFDNYHVVEYNPSGKLMVFTDVIRT